MSAGIHKEKSTGRCRIVILVTLYIKFLTTFKCFVEKNMDARKKLPLFDFIVHE
jgi:hypothetical protein